MILCLEYYRYFKEVNILLIDYDRRRRGKSNLVFSLGDWFYLFRMSILKFSTSYVFVIVLVLWSK